MSDASRSDKTTSVTPNELPVFAWPVRLITVAYLRNHGNKLPPLCACLVLLGISVPAAVAQDLSELYEDLKPSVVTLITKDIGAPEGQPRGGLGSGFIIDNEGHVMTAAHVVHTAGEIMVEMADGRSIEANIISSVPSADVALLKMTRVPSGLKPARLGDSSAASIGSEVMIIGAPFGLEHSLSVGHISGRIGQNRMVGGELMEVIQTDAAVNRGNSGGPMFNLDGEVIGIVSFILSASGGSNGIGFAVAINPTKKILLESPSFWTGFDALFLPPEISQALNVPRKPGLLVQRVIRDSLAGRAGLRGGTIQATVQGREVLLGGDIVLSIAGTACEGPHDFAQIHEDLDRLRDGDPFVIEVLRGGEVIELTGWVQR